MSIQWKKILVSIALISSANVNSGYVGPMAAPYGTSALYELHIVKNNGMDTHVKWRCDDIESCIEALQDVKYRDPKIENCKKVWIGRYNETLTIK